MTHPVTGIHTTPQEGAHSISRHFQQLQRLLYPTPPSLSKTENSWKESGYPALASNPCAFKNSRMYTFKPPNSRRTSETSNLKVEITWSLEIIRTLIMWWSQKWCPFSFPHINFTVPAETHCTFFFHESERSQSKKKVVLRVLLVGLLMFQLPASRSTQPCPHCPWEPSARLQGVLL